MTTQAPPKPQVAQEATVNLFWYEMRPSGLNKFVRGEINPEGEDIKALARSIKSKGLIQPIVVTPAGDGDYEILAGERRWWALQLMEKPVQVPCTVRPKPTSDLDRLVQMGIENIQRKQLPPIAEARYFRELMNRGMDLEAVVKETGCLRRDIENGIKLLDGLPVKVQDMVDTQAIPVTAARELAEQDGLTDEIKIEIAEKGRGMRAKDLVEAIHRIAGKPTRGRRTKKAEADLNGALGLKDKKPAGLVGGRNIEETDLVILQKLNVRVLKGFKHDVELLKQCAKTLTAANQTELAGQAQRRADQLQSTIEEAVAYIKRASTIGANYNVCLRVERALFAALEEEA